MGPSQLLGHPDVLQVSSYTGAWSAATVLNAEGETLGHLLREREVETIMCAAQLTDWEEGLCLVPPWTCEVQRWQRDPSCDQGEWLIQVPVFHV